jgi:hypothetical protein
MERKADHLLHFTDDLTVAVPAVATDGTHSVTAGSQFASILHMHVEHSLLRLHKNSMCPACWLLL